MALDANHHARQTALDANHHARQTGLDANHHARQTGLDANHHARQTGLDGSIVVSASGPTTDDLYWRADFERGLENAKWWEEHIGRPLGYGEFGFSFPGS